MISGSYRNRSDNAIAQGCLTNSKHPSALIDGLYPTHIVGAHGCHLLGDNGKEYLDYICGLGVNLMGYGSPKVNAAIHDAMSIGYSHSLPTKYEIECAEKLKEVFPFVDRWKFKKEGGSACISAVKYARAYTGRKEVLTAGYHGDDSEFTYMIPPAKGCTPQWAFDLTDLTKINDRTAAVIVEPVICDDSKERIQWLKDLREKCTKEGAVLIFDEIITGFRYKKYAVSNCYGVLPDLICVGKAMANGMPLAAVGGNKDILDDRKVFVSTTYAGEVLSLAVCTKVIDMLQRDPSYHLPYLIEKGGEFCEAFNKLGSIKIEGYKTRGRFTGGKLPEFLQEMARANILFGPSWFFNFDLIEHSEDVLATAKAVMEKIDSGRVSMDYPRPKSPFANEVRRDKN